MEETIRKSLPKLDCNSVVAVTTKLKDIGVESSDDMRLVKEEDLKDVLKPIEIRKFLNQWNSFGQETETNQMSCVPGNQRASSFSSPAIIKTYDNKDPNWPSKISIPFEKIPELKKPLEAEERLRSDLRRVLVRGVVDEVRQKNEHATKRQYEIVAERLVRMYPKSLQDQIDNTIVGSGYDSFMKQLTARNENLNRKTWNTHQKRALDSESSPVPKKKVNRFTDSYGCVNFSPRFEAEEEHMMNKVKESLKELYTSVNPDFAMVEKQIKETYPLQRKEINDGASIKRLIDEWPFLQWESNLLLHTELLIGINVWDALSKAYIDKSNRLNSFFRSEAFRLNVEVDLFFKVNDEEESCSANVFRFFPGVMTCVMKFFGEDSDNLFFPVDESATKEKVELNNKLNFPRLAYHGGTLASAKQFSLLVDSQVIIYKMNSFARSLTVLFAAYYVFNIEYPKEVSATLEFIQRSLVGINPDKGCKVDKKKKTSCVNPKVLKLVNDIASFEWCKKSEGSSSTV